MLEFWRGGFRSKTGCQSKKVKKTVLLSNHWLKLIVWDEEIKPMLLWAQSLQVSKSTQLCSQQQHCISAWVALICAWWQTGFLVSTAFSWISPTENAACHGMMPCARMSRLITNFRAVRRIKKTVMVMILFVLIECTIHIRCNLWVGEDNCKPILYKYDLMYGYCVSRLEPERS